MPSKTDKAILANIVKHIKAGGDDPLTPLIDEYLLKRDKPEYAQRRLTNYTIDLKPRIRPLGRLSPSSMGGCERLAAFKFLGIQGKKRIDLDQELVFEDGHWRHHKWQAMFYDMEAVLGRDRIRVIACELPVMIEGFFVAGSLDLIVKVFYKGKWIRIVIDIKGANNYAYERMYRERQADVKYVAQLITYLKAAKAKRGCLLFDSKDKNKFYPFYVDFSESEWKEISKWAKRVIRRMEEEELPPKHPDCDQGHYLYGKCPYAGMCFGRMTDTQIQKKVYRDFPGVAELWDQGHALIQAHED